MVLRAEIIHRWLTGEQYGLRHYNLHIDRRFDSREDVLFSNET